MFCIKCGKENSDNNKFCIGCGAELKKPNNPGETTVIQDASPEETLDVFSMSTSNDSTYDTAHPASKGSDTATTVLGDTARIRLVTNDGQEFDIEQFPAIIGKGSKADIIVPGDESISRQHFCIHEYGTDGFVIEDLESTNKTYINGNILENDELVVLNDGDTLKVGETTITVNYVDTF